MKNQALIVGGTTGMGRATAELLLKDGIEVILIARNKTNLAKAEAELSILGDLKTVQLDISDKTAVREFTKNLKQLNIFNTSFQKVEDKLKKSIK